MADLGRQSGPLPEKDRNNLLREIIAYSKAERGEDIGIAAATQMLDFFLGSLGPDAFRNGRGNAKSLIAQCFGRLETELDLLT